MSGSRKHAPFRRRRRYFFGLLSLASASLLTLAGSRSAEAFSSSSLSFIRVSGQAPVYAESHHILYHVPNPAKFFALGGNWSSVHTVSSTASDSCGLPMAVPYPSGTLIGAAGGATIYFVDQGILRPIANPTVFHAMGWHFSQVQWVPWLPLHWPIGPLVNSYFPYYPSGTLLQAQGHASVYEVVNGQLSHIPSATVFLQSGFQWSQIQSVSTLPNMPTTAPLSGPLHAYPSGTLLKKPGQAAIYVDESGMLQHIPNASLFRTLGFHFSSVKVVPHWYGNPIGPTLGSTCPVSNNPAPSPPTAFASMGYGFYQDNMPQGSQMSSYQDLLQHGSALSVINPAWYFVHQNASGGWSTNDWTNSIPTINGQTNATVITNAAHSQHLLVMPSAAIYFDPASGPITSAGQRLALVNLLVGIVQRNGYDGLTIDFENNGTGGMSLANASAQYTTFIQELGTALHHIGKRLMIATYASSYPSTIYNYTALAPYVDWINIMDYPEHNSSTPAGPTQGFPWVQSIVQNALATGLNPSKIILGTAPYGHFWTYTNSGVTGHTYQSNRQIQQYLASTPSITPIWDPVEKALVFTTGSLAQTPPASLSPGANNAAVANLQAILNIVLLRYALAHNITPPGIIWAAGDYGSYTQSMVALFQKEFNVSNATSGVYGPSTAAALSQAISQYHVGQTQWWDESSRSMGDLIKYTLQQHLAGIAAWRLPFETSGYWSQITSLTSVWHP